MTLRLTLLAHLGSLCAAPLYAQRGDRAGEVQLPPAAHIKGPTCARLRRRDARRRAHLRPPLLGPYRRAAVATRDEPWSDKELAELQRPFAPPRRAKRREVGGQ